MAGIRKRQAGGSSFVGVIVVLLVRSEEKGVKFTPHRHP